MKTLMITLLLMCGTAFASDTEKKIETAIERRLENLRSTMDRLKSTNDARARGILARRMKSQNDAMGHYVSCLDTYLAIKEAAEPTEMEKTKSNIIDIKSKITRIKRELSIGTVASK